MIFNQTHTLNKQVAVVIGGSGAIGSAICRHFAEAGATCVVTYNSGKEAAQGLASSLPGNGHWTAHIPVDDIFRDTDFVKGLDKKWRDEQAARTPLKRLATADEIGAATLAVLAHPHYSTGCIIAIDGGRPLA